MSFMMLKYAQRSCGSLWLFVDILIGFIISFFMVRRKAGSLEIGGKTGFCKAYTREGSMTVKVASDQFVNRIVTERRIQRDTPTSSSSSSSSGGSSSHTSSSGRSWRKQRFLLTDSRKVLMKQKSLLF